MSLADALPCTCPSRDGCEIHGRQPRVRRVPCSFCGRETLAVDAVCDSCADLRGLAETGAGPDSDRGSGPAFSFYEAAVACGHDPDSVTGAADARADYGVWDLVDHRNQGVRT